MSRLHELMALQCGVVARFQLVEHGVTPTVIRRQLRRRDLVMVVPGVYVDHTGELTWVQQAWVGVLALWPAALTHHSAIRADDGPGRRDPQRLLHVAVDRTRSPEAPPGVRLHQLARLEAKVQWNLSPPRVRIEEALLDVAAEGGDDVEAVAVLADAVQARRTTAPRLLDALGQRRRIARRVLLEAVLRDIEHGTCSALEHGYLTLVERPHGLPSATRQVCDSGRGPVFRDVEYRREGLFVELDGRLFHDDARSRDRDLDRDLDAAVGGRRSADAAAGLGPGVRPWLRHGEAGRCRAAAARLDRGADPVPALRLDVGAARRGHRVTPACRATRPRPSSHTSGTVTGTSPRPT